MPLERLGSLTFLIAHLCTAPPVHCCCPLPSRTAFCLASLFALCCIVVFVDALLYTCGFSLLTCSGTLDTTSYPAATSVQLSSGVFLLPLPPPLGLLQNAAPLLHP